MPRSRTPTTELGKLALSGKDDMPVQTRAMSQRQAAVSSSSRTSAKTSQQQRRVTQSSRGTTQATRRRNDNDDDDDDEDDDDDDESSDDDAAAPTGLEDMLFQALSIIDPMGLPPHEFQVAITRGQRRTGAGQIYADLTRLLARKATTDARFAADMLGSLAFLHDPWCQVAADRLEGRIHQALDALDRNHHNSNFVIETGGILRRVDAAVSNIIHSYFRDPRMTNASKKRFLQLLLTDMLSHVIARDSTPADPRVSYAGERPEHTNLYTNLLRNTQTNHIFVVSTLGDVPKETLKLVKDELNRAYSTIANRETQGGAGAPRTYRENAPKHFLQGLATIVTRAN